MTTAYDVVQAFIEKKEACQNNKIRQTEGTLLWYKFWVIARWDGAVMILKKFKLSDLGFEHATLNAIDRSQKYIQRQMESDGVEIRWEGIV